MSFSAILLQNIPFVTVGLGTYSYTTPSAGVYWLRLTSTEVPPSGISIVVNQNGSPIFTAPALSPTQGAIQFSLLNILCAAADSITIVLSSSNASDNMLNTVKTTVSIGNGQ